MNILFIISSLKHGGAEKQTIIDANLFSEKHNVTLITFEDGELKSLLKDEVNFVLLKKRGYLKTSKIIIKIIKENNIQIINASLFASMILAVLSAMKVKIPVIWYFHSHEYDLEFKSKIAYKYFSQKKVLNKIFFVSKELKDYFANKGFSFPEVKMDIIYNTYTVNLNQQNDNKKFNNEIIIGYIGRLVSLKRVEYLIEAAKYLTENNISNFKMNIIGDGESKKRLIHLAKQMQVENKVNFLGFKSNLDNYYNDFHIFAFPSKEECLPISLIDACVKSNPCIAFDIGGNKEIIINNETGFLVNNKNEFFEKIKMLIEDESLRRKLGNNAKNYCINKFDKNKRYKFLENVFENLNYIYSAK